MELKYGQYMYHALDLGSWKVLILFIMLASDHMSAHKSYTGEIALLELEAEIIKLQSR